MADPVHCFDILMRGETPAVPSGVAMLYGDAFLRSTTLQSLLERWDLDPQEMHKVEGDESQWIDVHDELATPSLFSEALRTIVVTRADPFIKAFRTQLEKWASAPAHGSLLILLADSAPGATRLGKEIGRNGLLVDCRLPTTSPRSRSVDTTRLKRWIAFRGKLHGILLTTAQTDIVLEAVGPECGLIDQELARLALYADPGGKISDESLRRHVGSWRTRTAFEIAESIAAGNVTDALHHMNHLLASGEQPLAVFPQIAWSLRRYGTAAHLLLQARRTGQRLTPQDALHQAGFPPPQARSALQHLKRMGLRRASQLNNWLVELDLKLKGTHSMGDRAIFALEELCLRLA